MCALKLLKTVPKVNTTIGTLKLLDDRSSTDKYMLKILNIITFHAHYFVLKVRRMVGVILAASLNKLQTKDVYEMITIPSAKSWVPCASTAPAFGLYLKEVSYNKEDKLFPEQQQ